MPIDRYQVGSLYVAPVRAVGRLRGDDPAALGGYGHNAIRSDNFHFVFLEKKDGRKHSHFPGTWMKILVAETGAVGWVEFIPKSDVSLVSKSYLRAHGLDSPLPSSENP